MSSNIKEYYLDNAATTMISTEVLQDIIPFIGLYYGNPSSLHNKGVETRRIINQAREDVAKAFRASPEEIYFTSGGSESDTWALMGIAEYLKQNNKTNIIISAIEHHAIIHTCQELEKQGFTITVAPVSTGGLVDAKDIEQRITSQTGLVSVMTANNEIGTIQPILTIGRMCQKHNVLFHTDAVQALSDIDIDTGYGHIDMMSISAHKIHGLKGCGALYIKKGLKLNPLIFGGGQENGLRAGTENILGIISLASALKHTMDNKENKIIQRANSRDRLLYRLLMIPKSYLNGGRTERLSGNINISFEGIEGEALMLRLNRKGIYVSTGSACNSGSLTPSHVLKAIGISDDLARSAIRISLDDKLEDEDIYYIAKTIEKEVAFLRRINQAYIE